jgi:hypothetical protein
MPHLYDTAAGSEHPVTADPRLRESPTGELPLLKEQFEPELIVLGRGKSAIHQVIEPDQVATSVGTQCGTDDGAGEPADESAKDKWPDARDGRPLITGSLRIAGRIGGLVNVCQHLFTLPKPRRGSPSTHWMARSVGASAHKSSRR